MAFFASCWSIIELCVIPNGHVKWFFLSFYIHPPFLILCRFFLWLKALKEFLSSILFFFLNSVRFLVVHIYSFVTAAAAYCFSFIRIRGNHLHSRDSGGIFDDSNDYQVFRSFSFFSQATAVSEEKMFPVQTIDYKEKDENKPREASEDYDDFDKEELRASRNVVTDVNESRSLSSACCCNLPSERRLLLPDEIVTEEDGTDLTGPNPIYMWSWPESPARYGKTSYSTEEDESGTDSNRDIPSPHEHLCLEEMGMNEDLAASYATGFHCSELEWPKQVEETENFGPIAVQLVKEEPDPRKDSDPFYEKYSERMKWFDVLSYERTCGISAIHENNESATVKFLGDRDAKKRLLKSLESDFELAYVAQMCLSWETLHHQYKKVYQLLTSSSPRVTVSGHMRLVGELQNFHVLVDRFLEEEIHGGKRYLRFIQGRSCIKSLLQVPELSGFSEEEEEQMGENTSVLEMKKVKEAIEKCIKAFYTFVETEKDKFFWKFKSFLWSFSPVEDPRDLQLLHDLTRRHQTMVLVLKDLQRKKKCWIKHGGSTDPAEDSQRKEILFTMIDLKLVARVLKMAPISSSQLKWCQSKIDNITFREGKVTRGDTCPLFPVS